MFWDTIGGQSTQGADEAGSNFFSQVFSAAEKGASRLLSETLPQYVEANLFEEHPLYSPTFNQQKAPPNSQVSAGTTSSFQPTSTFLGMDTTAIFMIGALVLGGIILVRAR